ncbi:tRNA pseudouridine(38-40) synthase TruA [Emticicia sp. TH156]|uniref:tRNA pseudouridine(38-40) synthase TruA n=1 Tax=Emticicia sp. TH156 TaxID=2067454 RepID=UPI000C77E655|nr:tRNA pseudouridine(38-40) synthase TruA [Emticicia sp. TH156]PLK42887.1 tRNA pseudouridine(38-40) synthase TruA [Emticicia sp. TH156]
MRYLIECSYQGTSFHGWQVQENAATVQGHIEQALSTVLRVPTQIVGSSRTDAGVHACQQFAHFDSETPLNQIDKLVYAVNGILPKDIAVNKIAEVNDNFHSRFDATYRRYLYRIALQKTPFWQDFSYFYRAPLDIKAMNAAGELMKNHIDFQCFSKVHTDVATFNCKIEFARWEQQDQFLLFHIKADRFLRGMVRAIVGTMLEVGIGKMSLNAFEQVILSKNRQKAGRAVPAEGLTLVEVGYPNGLIT